MSYRNKKLLKAISEAPCMMCDLEGQTQAAHSNMGTHGKGRSLKASDVYAAALCVTCHATLDSGKTLTREERQEMWYGAWEKTMLWLFEEGKVTCK